MLKFNWKLVCVAVCSVLLLGSGTAMAWCSGQYDLAEELHCPFNGVTDLDKYLAGPVECRDDRWYSDRFKQFECVYSLPSNVTTVRWFDPQPSPVDSCETVRACFSSDDPIIQVFSPQWTKPSRDTAGTAGPGLSFVVNADHDVIIGNFAADGGVVIVDSIVIAKIDTAYGLEFLEDDSLTFIAWEQSQYGVALNTGDSIVFTDIDWHDLLYNQSLIFVAAVHYQANPAETAKYVGQYTFVPPIPSLTNWGMIVLLVLLILSGIIVIRHRRREAARA